MGGGFSLADYWVWCGSVIKGDDGRYHMFASRWPKKYPFFNGYKMCSEIVRAESVKPEGPYVFREVVLPARGADYWDGRMTHNPTIHRYGDTYLLFYIGSTYRGDVPDAETLRVSAPPIAGFCIGMATARSVHGPWQRPDQPVLQPRAGKWDSSVVTNPAPCLRREGGILLYYRSNTPHGLRIGVALAKEPGSAFHRLKDDPVLTFAGDNFVEDSYVWWEHGCYQLIAKDMTGGITGEQHAGIHARSLDGLDWSLCDPSKAYSRRIRWDDGHLTVQGSFERPQLLLEDGHPTHLFAATADGPGGFRNAENTWNMVIPLRQ